MTNPANLQTLILELLADTRLQKLVEHYQKLTGRKRRLLLRLARTLT